MSPVCALSVCLERVCVCVCPPIPPLVIAAIWQHELCSGADQEVLAETDQLSPGIWCCSENGWMCPTV